MNQQTTKLVEEAQAKAEKAAQEWLKEVRADIESRVRSTLDRRLTAVIAGVMGFDNRWGDKWEVDHCNGRTSEVSKWIKESASAEAKKWLSEQVGKLPPLPKQAIASIRKEYLHELTDELRRMAREQAMEDARKLLAPVIGKDEA